MKIKEAFTVKVNNIALDSCLLLTRLVSGLAFMIHGWPKIQNPFSWLGPDAFAPGIFQALAAFAEFAGGFALIIGLLFPLASLGILITMIVAFVSHAFLWGDPFVAKSGGSYELALVYACVSCLFIIIGPGRFSLDKYFSTKE